VKSARAASPARAGVRSRIDDPALVALRRRQVVNAAIELFGKQGYHATTIRNIAGRAGISVGLIYQYFGDKEDVLFLAVMEVLESYFEHIPKATAGIGDPLERFGSAVRAYCRVIDANVDATVLAYRETKSLRKARRNLIKQKELDTNSLIARCVTDCIHAGLFENVDTELLVYQIVMFAHAWALKAWHFRRRMSVDEYVERGLGVMLNQVLTPRGRRQAALAL
jgi:TetR/AcrR family transcriptional regulator, cholesterol catabolism regulator